MPLTPPRRAARGLTRFAAGDIVVALARAVWSLFPRREPLPRFDKLTFQRGTIYSARLAPDGHTLVSLLSVGRLARAPLGGGAPREILDGVIDDDWSPDGTQLAVTREVEGEARLEYPLGGVLYRAGGYLSAPRISPDGRMVAFIKHQVKGDDRGSVAMVDLEGHLTPPSPDLPSVTGLAWAPNGREVWCSAWAPPRAYLIEAATPSRGVGEPR
jgi:hypothetical protein